MSFFFLLFLPELIINQNVEQLKHIYVKYVMQNL